MANITLLPALNLFPRFYANIQIILYNTQQKFKKTKKTALWKSLTARGEGGDSQNKWNNYTVRYWIELNMHTYYYLLLLLLLYTIFLFILSDEP